MTDIPEQTPEGDTVGPGRPPPNGRWQKGCSGNPTGKRKREESCRDLLKEELDALISVRENGKTITLSKRKAWVRSIVNSAIRGDPAAEKILMMIEKPETSPRRGGGVNIYNVDSEDEIPPD